MLRVALLPWLAAVASGLSLQRGHPIPDNLFLRIQKTGSTSFGSTMSQMFREHGSSIAVNAHYDWSSVVNRELTPDHVFTILRDPVERYLSELNYITWRPRPILCQNMWDFSGHIYTDGERLDAFRATMSTDPNKRLRGFLNITVPTRNRQVLYLLGFTRIPCLTAGKTFCNKNLTDDAPLPARTYDWDNNAEEILEKAKERIKSIHFGLTECMTSSVRGIASDMGWDADAAEQLVQWNKKSGTHDYGNDTTVETKNFHRTSDSNFDAGVKQVDEEDGYLDALDYDPVVDSVHSRMDQNILDLFGDGQTRLARQRSEGPGSYAEMHDPELIAKLRKHLSVEIRLYNYALELFNERHPSEQCRVAPAPLE